MGFGYSVFTYLSPDIFLKNEESCLNLGKIIKNPNIAVWKTVLSNFLGPPRFHRDRFYALLFLLDQNGHSQVNQLCH